MFIVFLGFSCEKVEASIISPSASLSLSDSLFDVDSGGDFGDSLSIVRSLLGSFSRSDDFCGNWLLHDVMNAQMGASNGNPSQATSKQSVPPAPSPGPQSISEATWMVLVSVTGFASDGTGCQSTAVPASDFSIRFSDGLTTKIRCEMPVQIRLHWLRSRELVHIPKVHVSELLRPPQVLGVLS